MKKVAADDLWSSVGEGLHYISANTNDREEPFLHAA